jgi:hypothetical protein
MSNRKKVRPASRKLLTPMGVAPGQRYVEKSPSTWLRDRVIDIGGAGVAGQLTYCAHLNGGNTDETMHIFLRRPRRVTCTRPSCATDLARELAADPARASCDRCQRAAPLLHEVQGAPPFPGGRLVVDFWLCCACEETEHGRHTSHVTDPTSN